MNARSKIKARVSFVILGIHSGKKVLIHFCTNYVHFSHLQIFRKVMHIMKTLFSRTAKVLDEMGKRGKKAKRR